MSEAPKMPLLPEPMRARLVRRAEIVEAAGYLRGLDKRAPSDHEPRIAELVAFLEAACREQFLSGWRAAREEAAKRAESDEFYGDVTQHAIAHAIRSMPDPQRVHQGSDSGEGRRGEA